MKILSVRSAAFACASPSANAKAISVRMSMILSVFKTRVVQVVIQQSGNSRRDTLKVVRAFGPAKFAPTGGAPVIGQFHGSEQIENPGFVTEGLINRCPNHRFDIITGRLHLEE